MFQVRQPSRVGIAKVGIIIGFVAIVGGGLIALLDDDDDDDEPSGTPMDQ